MTRQEFIEACRHEFGGMVLDAAISGLHGAELSLFVRGLMRKIDTKLGEAFDRLQPKPAAPRINGETNGHTTLPKIGATNGKAHT